MRLFHLSTLRSKLIFSFLGVALLPLLILSLLNQRVTQKALTNNANDTLLTAASQTALSIDAFVTTNLDALRVEAQLPVLAKYLSLPVNQRQSMTAEVEGTLRALSRKDTLHISSYALLDSQGRDVIDTDTTDLGKDKSQREYFQQPLKTGLPYVSSLQFSPTTREVSLYFSSPVRNAVGKIIGVLRVRYNATALQRLIVQNSELAGRSQSFAILLDENHIRLAQGNSPELNFKSVIPLPPERIKTLQAAGRLPDNQSIAELSTNLPAFEQGLLQAEKTPYFTTPLASSNQGLNTAAVTKLKTKPWFVVFVQPQSVFLAPIQAQIQDTVVLALIIAGVVIIAAVSIGQILAKPLVSLTSTVTQFTTGNLDARSLIKSKDEIGVLAFSFNTMAEQVGKLFQGLEERTRELELSQRVTVAVSELSKALIDPAQLLQEAIALMQNRFNLHNVQIYLLDQNTDQLIRQDNANQADPSDQPTAISIDHNQSLIAQVARTQTTIWMDNVSIASLEVEGKQSQIGSKVIVPLLSRGHLLGVLDIQDDESDRFSKTDLETFNTLAGQIATALENARLFEEIQKTEERFRTLFEDAPIGMAIVSVETHHPLQVNKALCEMLGYTPSELTVKTFEEFSYPEDIEKDVHLLEQMITGAIPSYQIEKRYLKKNQEILWGNLTATLIRDRNGKICYCLGMVENITERKQVQAALQLSEAQYRDKAQELEKTLYELKQTQTQLIQTEKMSSLGQLVAGVAHEINNPVNFIYGNVTPANEYLQDLLQLLYLYQQYYPNPVPEVQDHIEAIDLAFLSKDFQKIMSSMKIGAERIRQIVLSLRNFSRLDESEMKPVNIHEGIDNTLLILQNQLKDKPGHPEIQVIKEYGNLPLVECYAGQLNQVFMNLLTNSIDAMNEYNRRRTVAEIQNDPSTIWISTNVIDKNQVEIQLRDNGLGMTPEVQQKLFDPFFTTKAVGKGTGLGLSISYQIIVDKHKGQLQCISAPGKGAAFVIKIPIRQY